MRGAITWTGDAIEIIDQTLLPGELRVLRITTADELVDAIQRLAVRGAPALGVAGALGVLLAGDDLEACERIAAARPTAVNLRWAVARVLARGRSSGRGAGGLGGGRGGVRGDRRVRPGGAGGRRRAC